MRRQGAFFGKGVFGMREIPDEYRQPCSRPGRLEALPVPGFTDATVYLPAGYDGSAERYSTFYLLHGGGGDPHSFFSEDGLLKNQIDHMIASGEIRPLIVVAPTYYPPGRKGDGIAYSAEAVREFGPVLRHTIVPAVDRTYRTVPDRMHRGIGGFSMGAVATWYVLMADQMNFYWFMPMSGDCWICGELGGGHHARQTAGLLAAALQGRDFFLHVLTGGKDIAFPNLDPQMKAMQEYSDVFGKHVKYTVLPEGVHDYPDIRRYIYHALPGFFTADSGENAKS